MKKMIIIILLLGICAISYSEISDKFLTPSIHSPSIFNLNNITMNHTMSFSAGASSNQQSYYQSMYTNHINYQITPKLCFKLDLNFVNFGTASFSKDLQFEGNGDNESNILPEFSLTYKPLDNLSIVIEYKNYNLNRPWYYSDNWYNK